MPTKFEEICIKCQECCKWVTFTINFYDEPQLLNLTGFYIARGFKVVKHADCIEVMIPSICPKLKSFGCAIYSTRPARCRHYDGRKDPLMKDSCKLPKE